VRSQCTKPQFVPPRRSEHALSNVDVFQPVFSVTEFWDGPRAGATMFGGAPHRFLSVYRDDLDEWDEDRFFLVPITPEQLAWEVEADAIWRRFAAAHRGTAPYVPDDVADWGALPADRARYRAVKGLLLEAYRTLARDTATVARGEFRVVVPSPAGFMAPTLEVRWVVCGREKDDV
jgi:hypothetical protein